MNNIEQRSKEWFDERKGRFTGSQISKLMGVKGLGKTGESYIFEVVYKSLFEDLEEEYTSYEMDRGTELEPLAFEKLREILGKKFISIEKCGFIKYGEYSGSSPDGLTSNNAVIEIKCPKANTFFNVVRTNFINPDYYDQMQMEMLSTNRDKAYYFNYFVDLFGQEYWHLIEVKRDEKRIELIKERLNQAIELAKTYETELLTNKQF